MSSLLLEPLPGRPLPCDFPTGSSSLCSSCTHGLELLARVLCRLMASRRKQHPLGMNEHGGRDSLHRLQLTLVPCLHGPMPAPWHTPVPMGTSSASFCYRVFLTTFPSLHSESPSRSGAPAFITSQLRCAHLGPAGLGAPWFPHANKPELISHFPETLNLQRGCLLPRRAPKRQPLRI